MTEGPPRQAPRFRRTVRRWTMNGCAWPTWRSASSMLGNVWPSLPRSRLMVPCRMATSYNGCRKPLPRPMTHWGDRLVAVPAAETTGALDGAAPGHCARFSVSWPIVWASQPVLEPNTGASVASTRIWAIRPICGMPILKPAMSAGISPMPSCGPIPMPLGPASDHPRR